MYTLGTSAVQFLSGQNAGFEDALVAFVGTVTERDGGTDSQGKVWPPTTLAPREVFFILQPDLVKDPSGFTAAAIQTSVLVSVPDIDSNPDWPTSWKLLSGSIDYTYFQQVVRPLGGYGEVVYLIPRGNVADMVNAPHMDGYPFYARDAAQLYIYDTHKSQFVNVSDASINGFFMAGIMVSYSEQLDAVPTGWLRCDGSSALKLDYPDLFVTVEDKSNPGQSIFGISPDPNYFILPKYSNMIIKT